MAYRTTAQADQDIIDIYLWGCREFGQPDGAGPDWRQSAHSPRTAGIHARRPPSPLRVADDCLFAFWWSGFCTGGRIGKAASDFMPSAASKTDPEGAGFPCPSLSAGATVRWSAQQLAKKAGVSIQTIKRFEAAEGVPRSRTQTLLKTALEARGIEFIGTPEDGPGIRARIRHSD
jgi:hypothetical protein